MELEDRSRRCDLRIDRIPERPRKMWEQFGKEVKDMRIKKLGIENKMEINLTHRKNSKSNKNNKNNQSKPRTIASRLQGQNQNSEERQQAEGHKYLYKRGIQGGNLGKTALRR